VYAFADVSYNVCVRVCVVCVRVRVCVVCRVRVRVPLCVRLRPHSRTRTLTSLTRSLHRLPKEPGDGLASVLLGFNRLNTVTRGEHSVLYARVCARVCAVYVSCVCCAVCVL